jgi:hypothetical protein
MLPSVSGTRAAAVRYRYSEEREQETLGATHEAADLERDNALARLYGLACVA